MTPYVLRAASCLLSSGLPRIRRSATLAGALAAQRACYSVGCAFRRVGGLAACERDRANARIGDQAIERRQIGLHELVEMFELVVDLAHQIREGLVGLVGRPVVAQADRRGQLDQL